MPLPFIIGAVAIAAAAGGASKVRQSNIAQRVPRCPICDSRSDVQASKRGMTNVDFTCWDSDCRKHYSSIGWDPWILPEPDNMSNAPDCPSCGNKRYMGYNYKRNKYVCNKHKYSGYISGGNFYNSFKDTGERYYSHTF